MKITATLIGIDALERAISSAGSGLINKALPTATKAASQLLVDAARAEAPDRPRAFPQRPGSELRSSIVSVLEVNPNRESGNAKIGPAYDEADPENSPGSYGLLVEFGGHQGTPPEPFLRKAFDRDAGQAIDRFAAVIRNAVQTLGK